MKLLSHNTFCKFIYGSFFFVAISGCSPDQNSEQQTDALPIEKNVKNHSKVARAEIANATDFARHQEPVYFSLYDLGLEDQDAQVQHLIAKEGEQRLPTQLVDRDADGTPDDLLVTLDL